MQDLSIPLRVGSVETTIEKNALGWFAPFRNRVTLLTVPLSAAMPSNSPTKCTHRLSLSIFWFPINVSSFNMASAVPSLHRYSGEKKCSAGEDIETPSSTVRLMAEASAGVQVDVFVNSVSMSVAPGSRNNFAP
jgi:hypothetical protein